MKRKLFSNMIVLMLIIVLLLSGFYMGASVEHKVQNVSNESVEDIALVNLDEGIIKPVGDMPKVYYSNELLQYNAMEFEVVSLESARNGILEGRYAAYVILPADFSERVESVNDKPQKPQIIYAVNPHLDQETREKVIKKLGAFYEDINYDVSYLYVSAILQEFHDVQDASNTILKNDQVDNEELQNVEAEKLIALFTYPELIYVETEIEELDLDPVFEDNQQIGLDIEEGLENDLVLGKNAYEEVQQESVYVFDAEEAVLATIEEYHPGYDEEDNLIYQEGLETISENFARYNAEQGENGQQIKEMAKQEIYRMGAIAVNRELANLQFKLDKYIQENINQGNYYQSLKSEFMRYQAGVNAYYRQLGVSENALYDYRDLDNYLNNMFRNHALEISLTDLSGGNVREAEIADLIGDQMLSPEFVEMVDKASSVSMNDIVGIVDQQIIDKLKEQQDERYALVQTDKEILAEQISNYNQLMWEYNPYDYIDEERMDSEMELLGDNIYLIEEKQFEHDEAYLELIEEVYEVTESNQEAFDTNMEESQEVTRQNVETTIQLLKENKAETSAENKELLESFTQKLAYTRLGSLERTEAYDFVVSPVVFEENDANHLLFKMENDYRNYVLIAIFTIAGAILLMMDINKRMSNHGKMEISGEDN